MHPFWLIPYLMENLAWTLMLVNLALVPYFHRSKWTGACNSILQSEFESSRKELLRNSEGIASSRKSSGKVSLLFIRLKIHH